MKYSLVLVVMLVVRLRGYSQSSMENKSSIYQIQQQANLMGQAFLKEDYQTFARYTYPALVSAMGGESHMIAILLQTVNDMKAKGMSFSDIVIDSPSKIVKSGIELQCTLQQHTTITLAKGKAVAASTLIAISKDGGKNWFFVDTSNKDEASIRKALPNLSTTIIIPPQRKPIFYSF